ncbi:TVP38/TMEM64 family protein [Streptomyces sp. BBFR102]|uniref:TVP38/TMEM64 family protein n=1 Tax=Streptomyces sp. BBFR102 TaxID=3448171 RepID=UPI003F52C88B
MSSPTTAPVAPARSAAVRLARLLTAPWSRLSLLVLVLVSAGTAVLVLEPQQVLTTGVPAAFGTGLSALLFAAGYGLCTAAFVPRPLLNLAAGALFGSATGLVAAVAGTVIGAGIAFGLGRLLGQEALRPLLRGTWLKAADGQLSRHGFRSMLAVRLFPGVPFAAANYCAAVSRMGWTSFLLATAVGSVPNTAAYVLAGSTAASPTSPVFLASAGFIALSALAASVFAWRGRHRLGGN